MRPALTALLVVATASSAWAQGYTVSTAAALLEKRPADAARVDVESARAEKACAVVALPFRFAYYGDEFTTAVVSAHGWLVPGAKAGFANAHDPSAAHGQDAASGAFPYGESHASASGIVAPLWTALRGVNDGTERAGAVYVWTSGTAPARRFVVSWEDVAVADGPRVTVQAQLHEGPGRIVFAYATHTTGAPSAPPRIVRGIDSPHDDRFTSPPADAADGGSCPSNDLVLDPRTVLFNSPAAIRCGTPVTWQRIRRESLSADDSAKPCWYVAKGEGQFFVPDRAIRSSDPKRGQRIDLAVEQRKVDEDAATFGGQFGDPARWVKQVLDGKAVLVPRDGGDPVRLWFRVIEYFTLDDWGVAGTDHHIWNLRLMLHRVFPGDDPRGRIENYSSWRAMAKGRLSVVKLFASDQRDDTGAQFTTGRRNEYVLLCSRFRTGARGPLPPHDCPEAGWSRFRQKDDDQEMKQHADAGDLRDVPDPNYVDGHYRYVVRTDDDPSGWIFRGAKPSGALSEEDVDDDPAAAPATSTPR